MYKGLWVDWYGIVWTPRKRRSILSIIMTHQDEIGIGTKGHRDMHDITAQVTGIVGKSWLPCKEN